VRSIRRSTSLGEVCHSRSSASHSVSGRALFEHDSPAFILWKALLDTVTDSAKCRPSVNFLRDLRTHKSRNCAYVSSVRYEASCRRQDAAGGRGPINVF
jgi:hypothetical protein